MHPSNQPHTQLAHPTALHLRQPRGGEVAVHRSQALGRIAHVCYGGSQRCRGHHGYARQHPACLGRRPNLQATCSSGVSDGARGRAHHSAPRRADPAPETSSAPEWAVAPTGSNDRDNGGMCSPLSLPSPARGKHGPGSADGQRQGDPCHIRAQCQRKASPPRTRYTSRHSSAQGG